MEMPGAKEYLSVKEANERINKQKRLVLGNLRECNALFKERYPMETKGFSKFAELRSKECVLAGASGSHAVCVCLIHENFKFMILGGKLAQLTKNDGSRVFQDYKVCLKRVLCHKPGKSCFYGKCSNCPKLDWMKATLEDFHTESFIEEVSYSQWTTEDRCSLENITKYSEDFIKLFIESIPIVLQHVAAEWHIFGTSHGKRPSDGLGGMRKRLAARPSLQLSADKQIQTALE